MQTDIVAAGLRAFSGDLDRFVIFTLVLRQSLTRGTAIAPHARAISINSLASSLGRSFETVRRHVNALVADGLCARSHAGVAALDTALDRAEVSDVLIMAHDAFVRMIEDMAALDLPLPQPRPDVPYRHDVGVNAAIDIMLAVLATNIGAHREWLNLALFSTIFCANVRGFAHNAELARRYADERSVVPRDLIRPISAGAVARALSLPSATVRRRAAALIADGRLVRVPGGLVVNEAWLNRPEGVAISRASWANIRRILANATGAGFPFDRPGGTYMRGRPPYMDFPRES
jgi:DNA-binding Lrp family transcriptional regulator